jgi:hypothetical protein
MDLMIRRSLQLTLGARGLPVTLVPFLFFLS